MFKLFQNSQTVAEVIEEIHDTFYTEVDRLLETAKVANSLETDKQVLIEKRNRLVKLGFTSTKEVIEANREIERLNTLKRENEKKEQLIEAINYFSERYPNYKFITEESVDKICKKYDLVRGNIAYYIGNVPDKNLKHIEDYKIDGKDECWATRIMSVRGNEILREWHHSEPESVWDRKLASGVVERLPLEIVAPSYDFKLEAMEIKNRVVSKLPDPVVLKPVVYNKTKYYLVVTAWGLEAADELVLNSKHN